MPTLRLFCLALMVATASLPASAQRASLAERVAMLEQRAANTQGNVEMLERMSQLRTEVQALRAKVEELEQANDELRASQRTHMLDADARLQRLEGGAVRATPAAADAGPRPATRPAPSRPAESPAESAQPTGEERIAYDAAFDALKSGRYSDSARLFDAFLQRHPGGVYAPNALYWLGESYYVTQNYRLALEPFEQLLDRFPTHDKAPGALLKIGLSRLGLRQDEAARAAFDEVGVRYPGTDAARLAAERRQAMSLGR